MATETLEKLWSEWLQNKLQHGRAIGQMLQHLMILRSEVDRLKQQQAKGSSDQKK